MPFITDGYLSVSASLAISRLREIILSTPVSTGAETPPEALSVLFSAERERQIFFSFSLFASVPFAYSKRLLQAICNAAQIVTQLRIGIFGNLEGSASKIYGNSLFHIISIFYFPTFLILSTVPASAFQLSLSAANTDLPASVSL